MSARLQLVASLNIGPVSVCCDTVKDTLSEMYQLALVYCALLFWQRIVLG